ncbi:battenin [Trichonephila clavata]|uniref:Battenin n=1 Tax=Trichonephila clavata TaxID=2740835 RepID=A0A8X6L0G5_TRICU|nr:battenin [Trichonephila clavata]
MVPIVHPIIPETNKGRIRNLIGFWLLGLCNNYPYVIMLSAAFDLLYKNNGESSNTDQTNSTNGTKCNDISTGAILLADILPSLFIKLVAPFIVLKTHYRVMIAIILCAMSFIIAAFSTSHWVTFLSVICAALSSGLGEVTYLSYSSFFDKDVVSTWSSGTGGAGVVGALSYASLKEFFELKTTFQIMLVTPVLTAITFWIIIDHPSSMKSNCRSCLCNSEKKPFLSGDIDLSLNEYTTKSKTYTFREKITLIKPLLKYMIPLGLVYFAEYFINQGLMELLYFPNVSSWLPQKKQYRWYQVDYQVGVLISRSSVNIFQCHKLWILPILQMINLLILLLNVCLPFIPSIWIVLAIIFYEGLLGGCAYVNTFYKISLENHEDKEFSMGVASLGDSIGIALAGITALPVHDALCKLQSFSS